MYARLLSNGKGKPMVYESGYCPQRKTLGCPSFSGLLFGIHHYDQNLDIAIE